MHVIRLFVNKRLVEQLKKALKKGYWDTYCVGCNYEFRPLKFSKLERTRVDGEYTLIFRCVDCGSENDIPINRAELELIKNLLKSKK